MKREFFYQDDRSNKFWTVEVMGCRVVTQNGRIGATPRETSKDFPTSEDAEKAAQREISSKLRKGYQEGSLSDVPTYVPTDWSSMDMCDEVFWRLISLFNWKKTGDDEAVLSPAIKALASMSSQAIEEFENILCKKLHALDTVGHARCIGEDSWKDNGAYFSPDLFLYARCCVVANGKVLYDKVLAAPNKFPKDMEFEAILELASNAMSLKTGVDEQYFFDGCDTSYETFANSAGWAGVKP